MIMCLHKTKFEFLNRKKAGWLVMQTCHPNYLYLLAISLPHPCLMTYLTWLLTHIKWNDQALLWYTGNLNIYIRMCTMVCYIQHIWTEIMLMKEGWGWRRQKKNRNRTVSKGEALCCTISYNRAITRFAGVRDLNVGLFLDAWKQKEAVYLKGVSMHLYLNLNTIAINSCSV